MDVISRYRENRNLSSSEDDSEDSDNDTVWKRASGKKTDENEHLKNNEMCDDPLIMPSDEIEKIEQPQQLPEQPKPGEKRKRNTIWCDVLQDQLISEDLEDCLLKNKPRHYGSRGKESYDYTRAFNDERREDSESEMSGCSLNEDSATNSNLKFPPKYPFKKKFKKFVKLDSSELDAARKINKVLNEKKYYLIQRIVKFVGIEKAMHLLELTKEIEENGGMMIKNNARRRTPGGVYIQMLKDDDEVTKEVLDKIFEGEMSGQELRKYYEERKKRKKKNRHLNRKYKGKEDFNGKMEVKIEPMEPDETPMDAEVDEKSDVTKLPMYAEVDEKPDVTKLPMCAEVDEKPDVTKFEVNFPSVPVIVKEENVSDLEEGEIED